MTTQAKQFAWRAVLGCSLLASTLPGQNRIVVVSPGRIEISGSVFGEVFQIGRVSVLGTPNENVKFKIDRVVLGNNEPTNLIIVRPTSGTTPAFVRVGPNPNVTRHMRPNNFAVNVYFTTVDQSPPSTGAATVVLSVSGRAAPSIATIVNTASFLPGVSPGGLVSILGSKLGPPVLASEYDIEGLYPTTFGFTTVTFNGTPAPLLHVSPGRIDAVAPYTVAGQRTAQVVVSRYGVSTAPFEAPVSDRSLAIFTVTPNGKGQGDIQNYERGIYSPNSAENPASPGQMIVFYATGAGAYDETVPAAAISLDFNLFASPTRLRPVSLTIGGLPATIYYAGPAPYQSIAKLQVNAFVPEGAAPGPQPVVLSMGGADNAQQQVTVAIR
ncbi:MAG: hypothetical protein ACRD96_18010 [Bryobacteraceae bacterium]